MDWIWTGKSFKYESETLVSMDLHPREKEQKTEMRRICRLCVIYNLHFSRSIACMCGKQKPSESTRFAKLINGKIAKTNNPKKIDHTYNGLESMLAPF